MNSASGLEIHLLGAPTLLFNQLPLNLSRRQPLALLAYLLLAESAVSRDRLAFLLWPDEAQPVARNRLRMTLFQLRELLNSANAAHLLHSAGDAVLIRQNECYCDVLDFLKLTQPVGQLISNRALSLAEQANQYYRGEFLEGFVVQNAPEFESWVLQQRQQIERLHRRNLHTLLEAYAEQQNWPQAIHFAERLATLDPLDENNHCALLRLYAASGQRSVVVQHFEYVTSTLRQELGVDPLPETVDLYRSLLDTPLPQTPPPVRRSRKGDAQQAWHLRTTLNLPMIGRDCEVQQVKEWLNGALIGVPSLVCVSGTAGAGKTRLLHEVTKAFHYPVWLGGGQQMAQTTPYLAILRALRSGLSAFAPELLTQALRNLPDLWLAEASRLLPEIREARPDLRPPPTLAPAQAQARLFEALTRLTVVLAQAQGGAILVIDDLHDADAESLDWLLNLARHLQLQPTPLALAVAFHLDSQHATLKSWTARLAHDGLYRSLELKALPKQSMLELMQTAQLPMARRAMSSEASLVDLVASYSEGVPFVLLELLRAWHEADSFERYGQSSPTPNLPIPDSVQSLIRGRLAQLDPVVAQIFTIFVIAQDALELEELQAIAGRDELTAARSLDQLVELQLLRIDGFRYAISHTLLREVATAEIGMTRQRLLHRRIAETVQRRADGAGLAALHFEKAGLAESAAQSYLQAAQRAWSLFAAEPTLHNSEQALKIAPARSPVCFAIHALREEVLHTLGRRGEQEAAIAALLELGDDDAPNEKATASYRNGRYLFARNRWNEAEIALRQAQQYDSDADDHALRLAIRLLLGRTQAQQQRYDDAMITLQSALSEAQRHRDRSGQVDSLIALADVEQARERLIETERTLQEASNLGPRYDSATKARLAYLLGRLAFVRSRYGEALTYGQQAKENHEKIANREGVASALLLLAATLARRHAFGDALAHYSQAQAIFQQIGNRQGEAATLVNAGALALRSGDLARADQLNRQAIELFTAIGDDRGVAIGCINLGLTLVWQSKATEAEEWARRGLVICEARAFAVQHAAALGNLAAALVHQNRLEEAATLYQDAVNRRRGLGHADACCDAASLALVYLRQGKLSEAGQWSIDAVREFETERGTGAELGYRVYIGRAQVLHALGDDTSAQALLTLAQNKLQETLARFATEEDRNRFLAAVPFHRVLEEAQKHGKWANPPALV